MGLVLSALGLSAQGTPATRAPELPTLALGKVKVALRNPDPAQWLPFQLLDKVNPGLAVYALKHRPIQDSRGVGVQPVMTAMVMDLGTPDISVHAFARHLLGQQPLANLQQGFRQGIIFARGTTDYGGYTHVILQAFQVSGSTGLRLVCDTTDTVLGTVEADLWAWLQAGTFTPPPPSPPDAGPVPDDGITSFQDLLGRYRGVITEGPGSVSAEFAGGTFSMAEDRAPGDAPAFWIGPLRLQWFTVARSQFMGEGSASEAKVLESHHLWEMAYLRHSQKQQGMPEPVVSEGQLRRERAVDGSLRSTYAWRMRVGAPGKEATQFVVSAPTARGVVVLNVIATSAEEEALARNLIEAYRFTLIPITPRHWAEIEAQKKGR
jgi:hypothetical protein